MVRRADGGRGEVGDDRRWLGGARPLGARSAAVGAADVPALAAGPAGADRRRTGAAVAGARDGWAYVWPRDAAAVAMAFAAAGYRAEARRVAHFLRGLDLNAAARFNGTGAPGAGPRGAGRRRRLGRAAARAAGFGTGPRPPSDRAVAGPRRLPGGRPGDYLGNAIACRRRREAVGRRHSKGRAGGPGAAAGDRAPDSTRRRPGRCDRSPARPLRGRAPHAAAARRRRGNRFGIIPSQDWPGGDDPWTAPTAWTAWSLAALGERRAALRLMADLRRAATPLGLLPERVDARTGVPRSTTPLAWSHAFAILALRELW